VLQFFKKQLKAAKVVYKDNLLLLLKLLIENLRLVALLSKNIFFAKECIILSFSRIYLVLDNHFSFSSMKTKTEE
jgi:hypothetical protein